MNKPLKRSPEEFLVALYLSAGMTGNPGKNGKPATNTRYPKIPKPTAKGDYEISNQEQIRLLFYKRLSSKRGKKQFNNSLKNTVDLYDPFFPKNPKQGWKKPLKGMSKMIFDLFKGYELSELRPLVKKILQGKKLHELKPIFKKEFSYLNDENSEFFIERKKQQKEFIEQRLSHLEDSSYFEDDTKIQGSVSEIVHHFSLGIDRNLVQYFWSVEKKRKNKNKQFIHNFCEHCKRTVEDLKNLPVSMYLEIAHCNLYDRRYLLKEAIRDFYIDERTPIQSKFVLRRFIEKHEICPTYFLCKNCHSRYDFAFKKKNK